MTGKPYLAIPSKIIQSLQYKILHRIVACNSWLNQIKERDDAECNCCNKTDDLVHFFIECKNADHLWHRIVEWMGKILQDRLAITPRDIMFGYSGNNVNKEIINYCLILAKYYIYCVKIKIKSNDLNLLDYIRIVKNELTVKYEAACLKDKREIFELKWNGVIISMNCCKIMNNVWL